jgi:hypothetical protein
MSTIRIEDEFEGACLIEPTSAPIEQAVRLVPLGKAPPFQSHGLIFTFEAGTTFTYTYFKRD